MRWKKLLCTEEEEEDESWNLNKDQEKRILAFGNNCYRSLLQVHYTTDTPNVEIPRRIAGHTGKCDALLEIVVRGSSYRTPSGRVNLRGKDHAKQWREPDDHVAWRTHVSCAAPNGVISLRHSRFE